MDRFKKQILVGIGGTIAFFAILGVVGTMEYNEQVIYGMPDKAYYTILDILGGDPSETAIVKEYLKNKKYYDSL